MSNYNGNSKCRSDGSVEGLWKQFLSSGKKDADLRNRLVEHYLFVAAFAARQAAKKLPVDYDDLFQTAVIGLMSAVENFDPANGAKFETFGSYRVRGAIVDALREQDWVSRTWRHRKRELERIRGNFIVLHQREPTMQELAEKLRLSEEKVQDLLTRNPTVCSLNAVDREGKRVFAPSDGIDDEKVYGNLNSSIGHYLGGLNELERTIILMYFEEEFSMLQIGGFLGLSESRISQIVKDILLFLNRKMKK